MQRLPRCMNVSWPPCCLLPSAQIQSLSLLPEEAQTPLSIALTYTHTLLPSSSAISGGGGGRQHIRQLFCLEDSFIPFSGISSSIIILIIAFDPKNYQTSLKLMTISLSATNSWAFTKSDFTVKHWITLQCSRTDIYNIHHVSNEKLWKNRWKKFLISHF